MITVDVTPEIMADLDNHYGYVVCTPLHDDRRVLPSKRRPASGIITWTWKTIVRKITVTHVMIRLGERAAGVYDLERSPIHLGAGDELNISARLNDIT